MRPSLTALAALLCGLLAGPTASAGPITYTFEAPNFTVGQTTPLLNQPPNVGPATFRTDFTAPVTPTRYAIVFVDGGLPPTSGQVLVHVAPTGEPLVLTFNTPVSALSVDFFINDLFVNPPGFLQLVTPSGTATQASSNMGGSDQGGTLTFISAVPFSTATLQAFAPGGPFGPGGPQAPTAFAIDNLSLTPAAATVPEPTSLALLGLGSAALLAWRRRRRPA